MLNEIILHPGEHREIILLNEPDTNWHIIQEANSTLLLHVIALPHPNGEAQWHTAITVEHKATGCKTEMYGLALLHSQQQHHLTTRVLHNVGGGYSSQLFKFVLDDESKASFKGELKIMPDAQQVEAYQTNRNILLSRQAEMTTEPQLKSMPTMSKLAMVPLLVNSMIRHSSTCSNAVLAAKRHANCCFVLSLMMCCALCLTSKCKKTS